MAVTTLDQRMLGLGTTLTDHTIVASDIISFADVGASNVIKRDTVQGVLDLVSAGPSEATKIATTSGSSFTFTGIPSGTKRFHLCFREVGMAQTTATILIQLGDAGGIETTNYKSGAKYHEGTAIAGQVSSAYDGTGNAFFMREQFGATAILNGLCTFVLADAGTYTWVMNGQNHHTGTGHGFTAGGKSLSAELTQIKLSGFTGDSGFLNLVLG